MQASQRSAVGVALDQGVGQLNSAVIATGVSLPLTSVIGTFTGSGSVTVYDGSLTETVAVSAYNSGTKTLTCGALANAHPQGTLVTVSAAADAPVDYIPAAPLDGQDMWTPLEDKNFRGSLVNTYDITQGPIHGEVNLQGDFIADVFGYLLGSIFGDVVTTGGSAPFSHVFSALNSGNGQPKTLTLTDIEPVQPRAYPRSVCSGLSLVYDAQKQLSWTAKWTSFPSGIVGQPTKSFTTDRIIPAYLAAATIGGTYTPSVQNIQVDLARNITILDTLDGTASPYNIMAGPLSLTGKFTLVYDDETQLVNYLNNTQPSLVLAFTTGAGSAQRGLTVQSTRCAYSAAQKARSGDVMTIDVSFTSVANTTDIGASGGYSPLKVTLLSSKPANSYQ